MTRALGTDTQTFLRDQEAHGCKHLYLKCSRWKQWQQHSRGGTGPIPNLHVTPETASIVFNKIAPTQPHFPQSFKSGHSQFEMLPFLFPYQTCSRSGPCCASSSGRDGPPAQTHSCCQSLLGGLGSEGDTCTFKWQQHHFHDLLRNALRDWLLFSLTLGPFNLHKVCSNVFRVLMGNSLLHCFSFSLGKTFMKMCISRRILSRLILLMVSGKSRTILQRHYWTKKQKLEGMTRMRIISVTIHLP